MVNEPTVRRAIEGIAAKLTEAWNRHDAHAFAATFAEDADFTNVFGMTAKGRKGVEDFHAPVFATMFKDSRLTVTEIRIRLIRPEVAAADFRWEMSGARDPNGNPWPDRKGLVNLIATDHQGSWLIDVLHNMDLPSPDNAAAQAALSKQSGR
jgi:uncharacterized protein (TIGR02246 family)